MAEKTPEDVPTEVLDDEPKSILLGIISQLKKGMDLSKVTLPTFVLEPRSMLEKISDFMTHPDLLHQAATMEDPTERFLGVVRYYLSGWHIRPKGVKKPYNPVLGEFFRCKFDVQNEAQQPLYVAEQVSHHPPVSAFFYAAPEKKILISGDIRPKAKFLGNSAATIMQGSTRIFFNDLDEEYITSMPNYYARGVLFGSMYMETADAATIDCPKLDLIAELDFKTKGYFTGTFCGIGGKVKRKSTGETIATFSGTWLEEVFITRGKKDKQSFLKIADHGLCSKVVQEEEKQETLWTDVTKGLLVRNYDAATVAKTKIEDEQRAIRQQRESEGHHFNGRFFEGTGEDFIFRSLEYIF